MKFENTQIFNFAGAIRGMRNPMNSWDKSDSYYGNNEIGLESYVIGKNDLELMQKLIKAGSEHRKFMRQILVSVDITASLYWWKEADTYKVGTVSNSTSTMHKLASTPITMDCFEMDDFENVCYKEFETGIEFEGLKEFERYEIFNYWNEIIDVLERLRMLYLKTKDIRYWKELIRLLPESWLQKRTITMNYENILNMYRQRKNHKLTEWSKSFCDWVKTLPYAEELICLEQEIEG